METLASQNQILSRPNYLSSNLHSFYSSVHRMSNRKKDTSEDDFLIRYLSKP